MAIENFPLPTDVSGLVLGYVEDREMDRVATLLHVEDAVNREVFERLVNSDRSKWIRLNAIILDPRFYKLSAAGQNKIWERLDPSGQEIYDAVFWYQRWCGRVNCTIPEEYRKRFFDTMRDTYVQRPRSYHQFYAVDFYADIGRTSLEAACSLSTGGEMVLNIDGNNKPQDIRALVASTQKMAVKSLKITGTLTDEGFEILKSSGLQIDAKRTSRPCSWYFILAVIMLTSAMVIGGIAIVAYDIMYVPSALFAKKIGYMFLGEATAVWGGFLAPFACVEVQDFLERSHSQNRIFIPAAGVN